MLSQRITLRFIDISLCYHKPSDIAFKDFLTVVVNIRIYIFDVVMYNGHIPGTGHSFPVRHDFSHPEQESQ